MGMYTGLRGDITLKDWEFADHLKYFLTDYPVDNVWYELSRVFPEYRSLLAFSDMPRSDFIPKGMVMYLGWEDNYYHVNGRKFDLNCALKNYCGEIEFFVEKVLPDIAEDWYLEIQYEEWVRPITATKETGIDWNAVVLDY